jgi:hypothetical protein
MRKAFMTRIFRHLGTVAILTVAILTATASPAAAAPEDYGVESFSAALSTNQAGSHPDLNLDFELKTDPTSSEDSNGLHSPYARTQDLSIELPPGFMGNPNSVAQCSPQQFGSSTVGGAGCPLGAQVGFVELFLYTSSKPLTEPIYSMTPPGEDIVARLGFYAGTLPNYIDIGVRSESDYGLTATIRGVPANEKLVAAHTVLWGVPGDESHNTMRLTPHEAYPEFKQGSPPRSSGVEPAPFFTNPTTCGPLLPVKLATNSYQLPSLIARAEATLPPIVGCGSVQFEPSFSLQPTTRAAASPAGLDATLTIPQNETPNGRATSQLRSAVVEVPAGVSISPNAADGLEACSTAQVRQGENTAAECPAASKIGSAEFDVPALSRVLKGSIYQRTPEPGHLFRIWLVADELGVHVKIAGEIQVDRATGQITSVFVDTPQVPVETLKLQFKGGPRGVVITPQKCGTYFTQWEFGPWSGSPSAIGQSPFTIDQNCDTGGFRPGFSAGSTNPSAGSLTHFTLDLSRQDGEQNIAGVEVSLPEGLLAKPKGVPLCEGAAASSGQCPAGSKIGFAAVAAGAGSNPLWIPQPDKAPTAVYLSGPYKNAPYSLVIKVPAQAGPFDLGVVVTRAGIYVDPTTSAVTVKSDPLPQILEGVPIAYKAIHVGVDRNDFMINPTSCEPSSVDAAVSSAAGARAVLTSPFQVGSCASLGFKPQLSISLKGPTRRAAYPALKAVLKARKGDANIGRAVVTLPHSAFLEQAHIRTICTRVQYAADNCPARSVYGFAQASTPLLDEPLRGPVYLRSSNNPLPDLVAALHGKIDIDLVGRIDSVNGGIRTTFAAVPDAPVTRFTMNMQGGKKGLIVNSTNLCSSTNRATAKLTGQNGKLAQTRPVVRRRCGKKSRAGK